MAASQHFSIPSITFNNASLNCLMRFTQLLHHICSIAVITTSHKHRPIQQDIYIPNNDKQAGQLAMGLLSRHTRHVTAIAFSFDSQRVVSSLADPGTWR